MKTIILVVSLLTSFAFADDISKKREHVKTNTQIDSPTDLQRRVWQLERTVEQLQLRVFAIEKQQPAPKFVPEDNQGGFHCQGPHCSN